MLGESQEGRGVDPLGKGLVVELGNLKPLAVALRVDFVDAPPWVGLILIHVQQHHLLLPIPPEGLRARSHDQRGLLQVLLALAAGLHADLLQQVVDRKVDEDEVLLGEELRHDQPGLVGGLGPDEQDHLERPRVDVERTFDFEVFEEEDHFVEVVESGVLVQLVEDEVQVGEGHLLDGHSLELLPVRHGRMVPPGQDTGRADRGHRTFPYCPFLLPVRDVVVDLIGACYFRKDLRGGGGWGLRGGGGGWGLRGAGR